MMKRKGRVFIPLASSLLQELADSEIWPELPRNVGRNPWNTMASSSHQGKE